MTEEIPPVDVEVMSEVMEIKNLERTLRDGDPFYQRSTESLRKLQCEELTDAENERFVEGYSNFVDSFVKDVISGRLQSIYDENREVLNGTPEGKYIKGLIESSGRRMDFQFRGDGVYDRKVEGLPLSIRIANCLRNDGIDYLGQLVQKTEKEMLRTPNFGEVSLNDLKKILGEYGLSFGMKIDYTIPEESK